MEIHNIAIVGLGRIGTKFLEKTLSRTDVVSIKAVCELYETKGRLLAEAKNIPVMDLSKIVALGVGLDIIFDLTGDQNVTKGLRKKLDKSGNTYTQVAQNRLARLVWDLMSNEGCLPDLGKRKSQVYADMLMGEDK